MISTKCKFAEKGIQEIIEIIDKTVKENLLEIADEKDIAKQLKTIDLVREALVEKAKIQLLSPSIQKAEELLKQLQR